MTGLFLVQRGTLNVLTKTTIAFIFVSSNCIFCVFKRDVSQKFRHVVGILIRPCVKSSVSFVEVHVIQGPKLLTH